jgi:hypothetical protein
LKSVQKIRLDEASVNATPAAPSDPLLCARGDAIVFASPTRLTVCRFWHAPRWSSSMRILRKPLSLALALACVSFAAPALANDGKANLKLAPADAFGVIHINAARLRTSPLVKEFLALPDSQEALAEVKSKLGMNPETDLDGITIILPQDIPTGGKPFILLNGKYDVAKAKAAASAEGDLTAKGNLMVDKQGMAVAFENGRVVAGPEASVSSALAGKGGNGALDALAGAAGTDKDIWFAAQVPAALAPMLGAGDKNAGDIKAATGSLDLSNGALALRVTITTGKPESAKALAEMANAQIQGAGAAMAGQVGLGSAVKSLSVTAAGAAINISFNLTAAEVNVVKALALANAGGGGKAAPAAKPAPAAKVAPAPKAEKAATPAKTEKAAPAKSTKVPFKKAFKAPPKGAAVRNK